ncbi:Ig-like domain-containing protein [Lachnospiraceae bacterium CLA-AA-H246]|uniref:Ig-like domain-containing protein n=5 Tax=Lachnospiraceae TaxID=186803 RepID=A0ABS8EV14_9FIRM|nr:Ig-like domain-containing protein [Hominisplanchenecus faecis]
MVIPKKVNAAEIIPVNISVKYGQTEGRKIFDMINEMRTDSFDAWCWNEDNETKTRYDNLNELAYDYDLERIATKRAAELALLFDHGRPNGESFFSIYEEEGITYRAAGENIAMGYRTAEAVNAAWREDGEPYNGQGHRRNMLNPKFNCVGIGHVYLDGCHYWVEEFAYRTSVNTTETTANDSEQTMSLSVPKSKVTGLKVAFDKTSYSLRTGESTEVKLTAKLTVFGSDTIVTDLPAISVNDPSIATYSNGKITGVAEGSTTLTASLYGLTAADMPTINVYRCEHHWDQGEIITEPTCTEEGEKKFTCSICGDEKTEKVSATGHQHTEIRNKKEATCKETGYSGDTWCKDCRKKILSGQTIAKTENHSWDAGKVTTKATCTEEGEKTFTCSICGDKKTEKISATGHQHTEIRNKKEATCKETGYSGDTWCKDCGKKILPGQTIAKTENHSWDAGKVTTKATCTEEGEKTFTCSICGDEKTEKVSATGHQHTEIRNKKEATCKETGYSGDTWCKDCGKKILSGQAIAKTEDHSWNQGEITKEPTCKEKGEKTFTCSICGNTKTEKVSTTDHQHMEIRNQKNPTCKEAGYSGDTYCADCGVKISSGKTIAKTKNHNWDGGVITTEPTCTERGEKTFTCTICGNTDTKKVNATGHSYGAYKVVKEPTNKRKGLKSKTCSVCGKIVYEGIPKTNSSPTDSSETNPDQNPQTSQKTTRKIKLNRRKLTLKKGKSFRLKVTLTPADSQDKITYKTSNKKIATVSKTGKIKAKKKGKVKITVISGKKKAVCTVKVK